MRRRGAGFTLLELVVTLMVAAIISAVALSRLGGPREQAAQEQSRQRLSALELQVASVLSESSTGQWPEGRSLVGMSAAGASVVRSGTAGRAPGSVSGELRAGSTEVVLVQSVGTTTCLVLRYSHEGESSGYEYWGLGTVSGPDRCRAASASINSQSVDGTAEEPSTFEMS